MWLATPTWHFQLIGVTICLNYYMYILLIRIRHTHMYSVHVSLFLVHKVKISRQLCSCNINILYMHSLKGQMIDRSLRFSNQSQLMLLVSIPVIIEEFHFSSSSFYTSIFSYYRILTQGETWDSYMQWHMYRCITHRYRIKPISVQS